MQLAPGDTAPSFSETTILGEAVSVPDRQGRHVHLQFRRFAGCPVCNFHLLSLGRRHAEIEAAGIHQLVFFHSSRDEMLRYQAQLPFDCIADPGKKHFRAFGVEASIRALLNPRVLWSGMRGVLASGRFYDRAENGILGLPADFLIDPKGRVLACQYGTHADDHWDADQLLRLSARSPALR